MKSLILITGIVVMTVLWKPSIYSQSIPVSLSFVNESTAIPFTRFLTQPIHSGIQLGMEIRERPKRKSRRYQTLNLIYMRHKHLFQGVGMYAETAVEYSLSNKWTLAGLLGMGYLHTFATTTEFSFEDGEYFRRRDTGNPRFFPSLSFELGYHLGTRIKNHKRIFIRYQAWIEYPYSPGFIPVLTHVNTHIGLAFTIPQKNDQ